MKINNVEKFRKDLYTALKDTVLWDSVEALEATWKGEAEDYSETMKEYSHYKFVDDLAWKVSLPQPIKIEDAGKYLFVTVDHDGVDFYTSDKEKYIYVGYLEAELYKNRMSFAIAVANRINKKLEK